MDASTSKLSRPWQNRGARRNAPPLAQTRHPLSALWSGSYNFTQTPITLRLQTPPVHCAFPQRPCSLFIYLLVG